MISPCPLSPLSSSTSTASSSTAKRPNTNRTGASTSAAASTLTVDEWCGVIGTWSEGHDEQWFTRLCARSPQAPSREAYFAERRRIFEEIVPADPMHGVRELLALLRDARHPGGDRFVCPGAMGGRRRRTSRNPAAVRRGRDRRRGQAPEAGAGRLPRGGARLGVDPARSIAIEDSGPGIAAARAAGMKAVAIPHWLTARHDLSGADLTVTDAGELSLDRLEALIS